MALQSTYATSIPVGYAGMVANGETSNRISRVADEAIDFGQPVYRGANDHTCQGGTTQAFTATGANGTSAPAAATIGSITASAGAKAGVYNITCILGGATTTSKWQVEDPEGNDVGIATGNTAFSAAGIAFTITDAGTDPVVGEQFIITVVLTEDNSEGFLGISIADKTAKVSATSPDQYPQYGNVGILNRGAIWVTAGATVVAGDDVYWNPSTARFTKTTTHARIPGWKFDKAGTNGNLTLIVRR